VFADNDSGAFHKGQQLVDEKDCKTRLPQQSPLDKKRKVNKQRCDDLKNYADALLTEFLELR
jgi:hypothetical protein